MPTELKMIKLKKCLHLSNVLFAFGFVLFVCFAVCFLISFLREPFLINLSTMMLWRCLLKSRYGAAKIIFADCDLSVWMVAHIRYHPIEQILMGKVIILVPVWPVSLFHFLLLIHLLWLLLVIKLNTDYQHYIRLLMLACSYSHL